MRRVFGVIGSYSILALLAGCGGPRSSSGSGLTPSSAATPSESTPAEASPQERIVLMRDQLDALTSDRGTHRSRAAAIASAQAPLLAGLQASRARNVRSFELVNGFATSLSQEEAERLTARPDVLAVVPDRTISIAPHARRYPVKPSGARAAGPGSSTTKSPALCDTLEPEALQLTHTAFTDPTVPQAQEIRDGNGEAVTGKGVKVGIVAGGIDTTIAAFTRPDGSQVFFDYQDFDGDPSTSPTVGSSEMFGDAASIAAQDMPNGKPLNFDISPYAAPGYDTPVPCNIRVRGVAPGASLAALDISSSLGYRVFESSFVQAIDWAVVHDAVDVLNFSIGYTTYPQEANDAISLALSAAVRAGTTVVVAAGDSGSNDALGMPAIDPFVIATGATTQFRLYQQIGMDMFPLASGYLSDNVSSVSSGGFALGAPRTVDLVAPGDQGWSVCSTNQAKYPDCADFTGAPTPIQIFEGTSEAAPITSGAAALVIQAYRSTHGGASPTPATVKSILMGSATDLGASSSTQGAGLVNALEAVQTALSIKDAQGAPAPRGQGLVANPNSVTATLQTGQGVSQSFQITNTGTSTLNLRPALEALAPPFAGATIGLTLAANSPTFLNSYDEAEAYVEHTFSVPAGADHLDAAIAWNEAGDEPNVEFILLDPGGRQAAYSIPQGTSSGYGHVEVAKPTPGTWKVAVGTTPTESTGYSGPVTFTWSAERFAPVGEVTPSSLSLARGATASVTARLDGRSQPGDFAAALRLHGDGDPSLSEIPFTVRSLVPTDASGGSFSGTLSGGNGRSGIYPSAPYAFDVPQTAHDLALSLTLPDAGDWVVGYLVDPNGMVLASDSSVDPTGAPTKGLELYTTHPQAGRWRFIVEQLQTAASETSGTFQARISFAAAAASAAGLPESPHTILSASAAPLTVPVVVTNAGKMAKAFFADARLAAQAAVPLPPQLYGAATTLPGYLAYTFVPPRATSVSFSAVAGAPLQMNAYPFSSAPIVFGDTAADGSVTASFSAPEITYGFWIISPSLVGPFGPSGAPTTPVTVSAMATMEPFDPSVTADSGDFWTDAVLGTATYNPLVLAAGASGTITLTLTPDATQVGKTVRGFVYIDAVNEEDENGSGDEMAQLPYTYTVGK